MAASMTTDFSIPASTPVASTARFPANRRRRITPRAGHALEILGHAIEYLTDEFVHRQSNFSPEAPSLRQYRCSWRSIARCTTSVRKCRPSASGCAPCCIVVLHKDFRTHTQPDRSNCFQDARLPLIRRLAHAGARPFTVPAPAPPAAQATPPS